MAGCRSGTEAEILKEGLSSTQVIGFLAYGELSFTHLIQEPYTHALTCWGITFHSKTTHAHEPVSKFETTEIPEGGLGRIATGYVNLDRLLGGGIPESYAVVLTGPPCDERELLIKKFLETGTKQGEIVLYVTNDPGVMKTLAEESPSNFHLFVCNPQADAIVKSAPNVLKLKGVENLTDVNIALTNTIHKLDTSLKKPRRICMGIVSDVLLQHHAVQTRRWLNALIPELKSAGFTILAVMDPQIHASEEVQAIVGLFEGEINIHEKETKKGLEKYLKIKKMSNQKYLDSELPLKEKT
jgi:KaiC/GvpD/RAD55 family RecA-like ATPase